MFPCRFNYLRLMLECYSNRIITFLNLGIAMSLWYFDWVKICYTNDSPWNILMLLYENDDMRNKVAVSKLFAKVEILKVHSTKNGMFLNRAV